MFTGNKMKAMVVVLLLACSMQVQAESMKEMLHKTLKEGKAEGDVDGQVLAVFTTLLKTEKPVHLRMEKIYSFPSGCGRIRFMFNIADGKDNLNQQMKPFDFGMEVNMCQDGKPPSDREFTEWKASQTKKPTK